MIMEPEQLGAEIHQLQLCINDLVSILALPATWVRGEPATIAQSLLESLMSMLRLDLVYLRLNDLIGDAPGELVQFDHRWQASARPQEVKRSLAPWLDADLREWPAHLLIGGAELSVVPQQLGLQGEIGLLIAGSKRQGFPRQTERLLINVMANQATVGLQGARHLGEQKRIAGELDQRVARRTAELANTNAELRRQMSERRQAEEALAASERNLDQIINTIPGLVWSTRTDGAAEFFNQRYLDYVGLSLHELQGWGWTAAVHPDDRPGLTSAWRTIMAQGRTGETEARLRRFDGKYRWFLFRANPLHDEGGAVVRWFGINTDIEDRKRAEEALRSSEWSLRRMTETIPQMLWSATPDGALDHCNGRLLDYTGFSAEQAVGDGWAKMLHPEDATQSLAVWRACVACGAPYQTEARLFHAADQTYRWCLIMALPLRDEEGHIVRWHGSCVDMHNWKEAQDELRDTQAELARVTRVMTMGQLTASIAHEINQPLAGIMTNASTCLRMLGADPPNVTGALETARRTIRDGRRASDVIARLRDLFSKRCAATEVVDLNAAAEEVIALTSAELQRCCVTLRLELAENLPSVKGDRVQLQQVVLNLVLNAAEAMRDVDERRRELLIATGHLGAGKVCLAVTDSGVGFDAAAVERLFTPFYTTKSDGMGIGLSVSRSIIANHQGRLWAEPNEGPGATFRFSLPCRDEGPAPANGSVFATPPSAAAGKSAQR